MYGKVEKSFPNILHNKKEQLNPLNLQTHDIDGAY
jgi:hypothetical protein